MFIPDSALVTRFMFILGCIYSGFMVIYDVSPWSVLSIYSYFYFKIDDSSPVFLFPVGFIPLYIL